MNSYITENITFKQIFNEKPKSLPEYLFNIDKEWLLRRICYIIGINSIDSFSYSCQNFIKAFFQDYPKNNEVIFLQQQIINLQKHYPDNVILTFCHPAAALNFLRECILLPTTGNSQEKLEDLMNLFKAYLIFNENRKEKFYNLLVNIKVDQLREAKFLIAEGLQEYFLTEYNIHDLETTQELKFLAFTNFLKKHSRLKTIFEQYIFSHLFSNPLDFILKAIIPLKVYHPSKFKEGYIALEKEDYNNKESNIWNSLFMYWNSIAIDINNMEEANQKLSDYKDYTCFKQYPLLKINNETFLVVSPFFYALKFYDSLRLDIKFLYENEEPKQKLIPNYNSLITKEFSEYILLYKTMDQLLGCNKYITFTGKFFEDQDIKGRPDFYVRNKKQLFLFEFKDMLINKNVKDSNDIEDFIENMNCKLNTEKSKKDKKKNKGIPQLISNIEDILLKKFEYDNDYNISSLKIYPILIIDNRVFSLNGINYILNEWFQIRVKNNITIQQHQNQIMPLLVLDYDLLFIMTVALKNNFKEFVHLYHSYQAYLKRNKDTQLKFPSFRNYILNNHKLPSFTKKQSNKVIKAIIE